MIFKYFVIIIFLIPIGLSAQDSSITIGKRKNIYWGREIKTANLGNINTYYYPIYYRGYGVKQYKRIGIFGHRLKPLLHLEDKLVYNSYNKYRRDKKISYVLAAGSAASLFAWGYFSANDILKGRSNDVVGVYFKPKNIAFLGGYALFFAGSVYFNLNGDKHLKRTVKRHNKVIRN